MGSQFIPPLAFTAATSSPAPLAGSVANLANDVPGFVWRSGLAGFLIVDMGAGTLAYDTISIMGSNLRATDTVRVQTGTTTAGTGGYAGLAVAAWAGVKADSATAISVIRLGAVRSDRYIRIDFSAAGHPDNYVQFFRLVVGKAIVTIGTDGGYEDGFDDQSIIVNGPGYRSVDEMPVLTTAKLSTGWISETSWRNEWAPMLQNFGSKRGILFIRDDEAGYLTDIIFGCITSKPAGKAEFANSWRVEATITSVSQ